jgi:glucose-6-phosphate isomerase
MLKIVKYIKIILAKIYAFISLSNLKKTSNSKSGVGNNKATVQKVNNVSYSILVKLYQHNLTFQLLIWYF